MTQRTPELQKLLDNVTETMGMEHSTAEILDIGGSHKRACRCGICLRFWVLVGPEEGDPGEWGFGPFTEEEYIAAGGVIPDEYDDDEEEEEEWDG